MRYRVPQNIDMEDKIIGPLTMAQFLFVMVGAMLIYSDFLLFGTSIPLLFWITAIPLLLVTLVVAFLKVQDQPFPKFLASVLLYLTKPKVRIWQKDPALSHLTVVEKRATTPEQQTPQYPTIKRTELESFATLLDTGVKGQTIDDRSQPPQAKLEIRNPNTETNSKVEIRKSVLDPKDQS